MNSSEDVVEISTEALLARMARPEPLVLVEALAEKAYRSGHLPGALNLPRSEVPKRARALIPDLHAEIVVYCRAST